MLGAIDGKHVIIQKPKNDGSYYYSYKQRSGIPELDNLINKPSYGLWRHKVEFSQIATNLI